MAKLGWFKDDENEDDADDNDENEDDTDDNDDLWWWWQLQGGFKESSIAGSQVLQWGENGIVPDHLFISKW